MTKRSDEDNNSAPARIAVRLTPRGGSDKIDGWVDGTLRVRVAAPAVDGRANQSLIRLIARALEMSPTSVTIVAGAQSRVKRITIEGRSLAEINQLFGKWLRRV